MITSMSMFMSMISADGSECCVHDSLLPKPSAGSPVKPSAGGSPRSHVLVSPKVYPGSGVESNDKDAVESSTPAGSRQRSPSHKLGSHIGSAPKQSTSPRAVGSASPPALSPRKASPPTTASGAQASQPSSPLSNTARRMHAEGENGDQNAAVVSPSKVLEKFAGSKVAGVYRDTRKELELEGVRPEGKHSDEDGVQDAGLALTPGIDEDSTDPLEENSENSASPMARAELVRLAGVLKGERNQLFHEQASLKAKVKKLEQDKAVLDREKADIEQDKATLQDEKEVLIKERAYLDSEISKLEAAKEGMLQQQRELQNVIKGMEGDKAELQGQCNRLSQQHASLEARAKQLQDTVMSQQDFEKKLKDFHEMVAIMQNLKDEGAVQKERLMSMERELEHARVVAERAKKEQAESEAEIARLKLLLASRGQGGQAGQSNVAMGRGIPGHGQQHNSDGKTEERLRLVQMELDHVRRELSSRTRQLEEAKRLLGSKSSAMHEELEELASDSKSRTLNFWDKAQMSSDRKEAGGENYVVERQASRSETTSAAGVESMTRDAGKGKGSVSSIEMQALQTEKQILVDRIRSMERDVLMNRLSHLEKTSQHTRRQASHLSQWQSDPASEMGGSLSHASSGIQVMNAPLRGIVEQITIASDSTRHRIAVRQSFYCF